MKIHWGYGIMIATALFMAFILTLVYKCTKQNVDLVSTNYYEQELKYDEQILKEKNTSELAEDLRLNFDKDKQAIKIQYPSEAVNLTGEISFVRPDDAKLDFNVKIMSDNTPMQSISTTQMKKGRWNIKVNWRQNERGYYHKQTIFIK